MPADTSSSDRAGSIPIQEELGGEELGEDGPGAYLRLVGWY